MRCRRLSCSDLTDSRRSVAALQTACLMDLFTKAAELGIQTEFYDGQGHRHVTDAAALKIILDAMPARAAHRAARSARRWCGPAKPGLGARAPRRLAAGGWKIVAGDAMRGGGRWRIDRSVGLAADSAGRQLSAAAGRRGGAERRRAAARRAAARLSRAISIARWIVAVQLYGLRSSRNWGIGDFTDLARLIEIAAGLGAGGIGLNPLHALFDDRPGDCSPYSPNSRLFLNPLYIDVEHTARIRACESAGRGSCGAPLRDAELVDYRGGRRPEMARAACGLSRRFTSRRCADRVAPHSTPSAPSVRRC